MNVTVSPELAVAFRLNGGVLRLTLAGCGKVTVCGPGFTVKVRSTVGAAAYVALPSWLATNEHVPPARIVTVLPATVQIAGVVDAKLTGNPELAVALIVYGETS